MASSPSSPLEQRNIVANSAREFQQLAFSAAELDDRKVALSAQISADINRAMAAIWSRAEGDPNPFGTFEGVCSSIINGLPLVPDAALPSKIVSGMRQVLTARAASHQLSFHFPDSAIPDTWETISSAQARIEEFGDLTLKEIEQFFIEESQNFSPGSERLSCIVQAFLIAEAETLGEEGLMSFWAARALALKGIPEKASEGGARDAVKEVLGELRTARLDEYARPRFPNYSA